MTDVLTPPPPPAAPAPPAPFPPAPPGTSPGAVASGGRGAGRRPGRRFVAGLATGIAASAITVGAVALVNDAEGDGTTTPTPVGTAPAETESQVSPAVVSDTSSLHQLVVAVRPSIVAIHTTVTATDIFGRQRQGEAAGSGFVLSSDGYIVTNNHVIEGADAITVALDDGSTEDAELVGSDARSDLAVLHIDRADLTPIALGDSDALQVGDPVVAIGNALDLGAEPTVTLGIVSAKDRTVTEPNGSVLVDLLQTDAAINPGNSGGPLVDLSGNVVGINTVVAGQAQNIGFAIAVNPAQAIIDALRNGETPRHAFLGVSTRVVFDRSGNPIDGAEVTSVQTGSAADAAGIAVGDLITSFDGTSISSPHDLVAAILRRQPGDTVSVEFERDGEQQRVEVTLGAHDETSS